MPDYYPARRTAEMAGLTRRQLAWWDDCGYVEAYRGKGNARFYDRKQVALLRVLGGLRAKGFSLQRIRKLLPQIVAAVDGGAPYILVAGRKAHAVKDRNLLAVAAKARSSVYVVDVT